MLKKKKKLKEIKSFIHFVFCVFFEDLFILERQHESEHRVEVGRKRQREKERILSRFPAEHRTQLGVGSYNLEIMTRAKNQEPDAQQTEPPRHPGD